MGRNTHVRMARSKPNPPLPHVTAGLTQVFILRRGKENCRVQAAWQARVWDDFPPAGGCVGFMAPRTGCQEHTLTNHLSTPGQDNSPRTDRLFAQSGTTLPCRLSAVLQRRATFHLGRKFLWPKARSYFKQAYIFGQKPNSVSQMPLTMQAVPSSKLGH